MSSIINKIYHKQPPRDGYIAPTNTPTFHEDDYMPVSPSYECNNQNSNAGNDAGDENTNIDKPLLDFLKAQFIELTTDNQNLYKKLQENYMEKQILSDKLYETLRENTDLKNRLQYSEKLGKSKSSMIKDFKVKNTPYNRKR